MVFVFSCLLREEKMKVVHYLTFWPTLYTPLLASADKPLAFANVTVGAKDVYKECYKGGVSRDRYRSASTNRTRCLDD